MNVFTMLKKPSGFLPVTMSLAALSVVLVHIAIFGQAREVDEGAAAYIWQILMVGQIPIMGFFVLRWLPQAPRTMLLMLALQIVAALTAVAPVYFLQL